jgi:DMSO/TMAO reductase YedYZ molybdopterin-dependent catalytic subunit
VDPSIEFAAKHVDLSRRYFLKAAALVSGGMSAAWSSGLLADEPALKVAGKSPALDKAIAELEYFTQPEKFGTVERGTPLPYTHPPEKLREVGMVRETWRLEVVADEDGKSKVDNPLSKEKGTALDWDGLMKLAETKAVRFPKIMTCNNGGTPLGMGLWEGVPLRDIVWMARPGENIRRLFYHGYHNDDPKQIFRSSLPIGRVLEDAFGLPPVIVAYKLNGELLSGKRGGPARIVVPEAYGFKSVKWLQRVVLTHAPFANDTYADGANDVDSGMKTFARFVSNPARVKTGEAIALTGYAQVGVSGLTRVQVWIHPKGKELPADDPHFTKAPWQDAELLAAPTTWTNLPEKAIPSPTHGFSEAGTPTQWPMRFALAHWAALLPAAEAGEYEIRCRTIDAAGIAQPMPRPFPKSGRNGIQMVSLKVES